MKKTEGQKSRDTVPLTAIPLLFNLIGIGTFILLFQKNLVGKGRIQMQEAQAFSMSVQYREESVAPLPQPPAATVAQPGSYSSAAEKMMMKMGYKSGTSTGVNYFINITV